MLTKVSILLFYLRVLSRTQEKLVRWIIIGTLVFVVVYSMMIFFGYGFNCNPPKAAWMLYVSAWTKTHKFKCGSVSKWPMFSVITNCLTDYWITLLPLAFIGRLNLQSRQKKGLLVLFGAGFL